MSLTNLIDINPATTQKRLGDYADDNAQYQALMSNAVTTARSLNLRPGIALSQEQMARLTSDIVWLVEQSITLPDGRVVQALVPQVYLQVRAGDLRGDGALIAGRELNINTTGDATNSGTIAGRSLVSISADNINNLGGAIFAERTTLKAAQDINNTGGSIGAANALQLQAGRDVNITSTTAQGSGAQAIRGGSTKASSTRIDRVASLYVTGQVGPDGKASQAGTLVASAGRDIRLTGAIIANNSSASQEVTTQTTNADGSITNSTGTVTTNGSIALIAKNNIDIKSITESESMSGSFAVKRRTGSVNFSQSQEVGSQITAAGDITIQAGNDITARAATLNSSQGC